MRPIINLHTTYCTCLRFLIYSEIICIVGRRQLLTSVTVPREIFRASEIYGISYPASLETSKRYRRNVCKRSTV